jgi:hypothetical protein
VCRNKSRRISAVSQVSAINWVPFVSFSGKYTDFYTKNAVEVSVALSVDVTYHQKRHSNCRMLNFNEHDASFLSRVLLPAFCRRVKTGEIAQSV